MTVKTIIKQAIKRLELEGNLLTPDAYASAFCKEAAKAGMKVEDCNHVEKYSLTLNKEFQKEFVQYRIKSVGEFIRFLVSRLNRTNSSTCLKALESQTLLTKRVLQAVECLHNKKASDIAKSNLELLALDATPGQMDQYAQLWINFVNSYDDAFLQELKPFGVIDEKDLTKTITTLNFPTTSQNTTQADLSKLSLLLVASFVPSIAAKMNKDIAQVSEKIRKNPEILTSATIEQEIKSAIALRIALDKKSVKEMIESIDGVLDRLSLRLIDMIESSDTSNGEIQKIKRELEAYKEDSELNFKTAHKKLYTIAVALEKNTQVLSRDLKEHSSEVKLMSAKIKKLEKELEAVKQESKEDFLTKLYNKRALDEFFQIKEGEFERYSRNFSIVMFDLDHFKSVNDNYGHDAGDAVLSAFAKILKKEARSVDVVGRFGGEEFMALLSETDAQGGATFAEKVRTHVQNARFMYKGERINVTVSCGVSERSKYPTLQSVIDSADANLYKAKNSGRNRVVFQ